jgi:hypothetical protein
MNRLLIACGAVLILAASCTTGHGPIALESRQYADSTAHSYLKMDVELPLPAGKAAAEIRRQLVDVMDEALSHIDTYEEARAFPPFDGDANDSESLFSYYESRALESIGAVSDAEARERAEAILEAEDLTDEEKQMYISRMPGWGYEFSLKKMGETDKYVVFDSENYMYRGGAHGGIIGAGPMTFRKKDGARITDFFLPDCLPELQPVLTKGLAEYFREPMEGTGLKFLDYLNLKDGLIPLSEWAPYPAEDGLHLIYQQYEIGAYAFGMPSCTLPWEDVEPFLTPEAKALL